jgi:hypothetical protein
MANLDMYLEAERRGILPPDKAGILNEARARGLVPATPAAPAMPQDQMPGSRQTYTAAEVPGAALQNLPASAQTFCVGCGRWCSTTCHKPC